MDFSDATPAAKFARLQRQVEEQVTDLMVYLTSPKFLDDPTVQVSDVMNRLETLRSLAR